MKAAMNKLILITGIIPLSAALVLAEPPAVPVPPGAALPPPAQAEASAAPKLQFETPVYDFGKAKSGELVKHIFVFTNIGAATLDITAVRPGCGCTTTGEWTRKVEPGKTGSIPIQVNTANFNGPVTKVVSVDSNDKTQTPFTLQIKGTIWKPIDVNPQFAVLNIPADAPSGASTIVRIVNNTDEPITLSAPESNNRSFVAEIKATQPGKEFQLTISALPPLPPGNTQGQITIKTSSTNAPVLTVTAWANVQPAITIGPTQIALPPGPLATKSIPSIRIENHGTNALQLTDAAVNAKDVDVQITESQPGRLYTATLTFPQGFEIAQGQQVEFTVKSNHPQYPVLKIPVTQMARPAQPPVVPVKPSAALPIPPQAARVVGQ